MRTSLLTAAATLALAITVWSPGEAKAQIVYTTVPTVDNTPFLNPNYWVPNYNYGYNAFSTPLGNGFGVNGLTYGYTTPYGYGFGNWAWPSYNPYYSARPFGYMSWPNYMYRNGVRFGR
jgi:hypothetical protein